MDYEKAYKEALNRAKHALDCHNQGMVSTDVSLITSMFPELGESEDEKIRKELIDAIQGLWDNDALPMPLSVKRKDKWLAWLEKQGEQKQEWSEEDENRFQNIIACIEDCYNEKDAQDLIRWLKSFKNRVQPKQEWSDKDEEMTEELIKGCVSAEKAHHFLCTPKEVSDWLKSIKDRIIGKED